MKINLSWVYSLILLFFLPAKSLAMPGDVNGDGRVNGADVTFLEAQPALPITSPPYYRAEADVDQDGSVDTYDLYRLKKYLATGPEHGEWDLRFPIRTGEIDFNYQPMHLEYDSTGTFTALFRETTTASSLFECNIEYNVEGAAIRPLSPP